MMNLRYICIFTCLLLVQRTLHAQNSCSTLGQTPYTAFPVCGTSVFSQTNVPICTNNIVVVPGCAATTTYTDKNPFWYKFTCFQSGTLGFVITPNDLGDDYDWQLFDVTAVTNLNEVYSNASLFVAGNWSGSYGLTGASATANSKIQCSSSPPDNIPTFSSMPQLIKGHNYLLLVSHYSDSQSGYLLSFGGGTAVITDPKLPTPVAAKPSCDASSITIRLNKKMKCNSLTAAGSEFTISPNLANVVSAIGYGCSNGFDLDSLTIKLSNPLPVGNYNVVMVNGTDENTLLDNCDRGIPSGTQIPFVIQPILPTLLDSLVPVTCAPQQLQLVFKKNILCSSISADGSDFVITGPYPVSIIGASGLCNNGESPIITVKLASPIVNAGNYQIHLRDGLDGNTIIDECGQHTPPGGTLSFTVKDTVSALFSYNINWGCRSDTVSFMHDGAHGITQWLWQYGATGVNIQQNFTQVFNDFGDKNILLIVSNGFCSDTAYKTISLNNTLTASFTTSNTLCPEDAATFLNSSIGNITSYTWSFGNGQSSNIPVPTAIHYSLIGTEKIYTVQLIVENAANCFDTTSHTIKVLKTCYITVPNAFTPNNDGKNDLLYPLNAYKTSNLDFNVYNRWGQLVFHTTNWQLKWDGTVNGHPQNAGTYAWTLRYTELDTGKKVFLRGTTILIR